MKKAAFILTLCGLSLIAKSQNASVEKSTFGVQTGVLGLWAYNEVKLSNSIALRTELGFDFGIWETTYYDPELALFNTDDAPVVSDFAIIPTWGIRRKIGDHFNYEAGIGAGYSYTLAERAGYSEDESGFELNMHLRIGYRF